MQVRDELELRVAERTAALSESNTLLSREIADRKRVQEALTESEKRYRTVSELTSDLAYAFRVEPGGTLVFEWVTAALKRISGFTLDELRARGGWKTIIYPDDLGRVKDQWRALLEGRSRIGEYRILTAEGQFRWLRDYGRPVWGVTRSRVTHIYGAVQDITEQRRAEDAQKESEKKYRILVENANEGIIVAQDGFLKFTNPRLLELSGYSEEELIAHPFMDFVHLDDRKMAVAHHLKKFEHPEKAETYNLRIIDKSGKVRWVENSGIGINWETRPATLNFLSDITDRILAEQQLLESKAMLQAVFDGILDPLLLIGRDMATKMLNRAAVEYFGVTDPREAIGQLYHHVFKGKSEPCEECKAPEGFSSGDFITYERRGLMNPDRYERIVMYPLKENGDHTGDAIVHIRDITKRRLFERQFVHREKLASLGVLVSSIAHQINNPNNFVSFNIPILREYIREMIPIMDVYAGERPAFEICNQAYPEFRQDIFKLLDNVEHGSGRISAFVSTLREFSLDQAQISQRWVDLKDVIERVISICNSKIQNSVNSFDQSVPEHLPRIYTEPYALEQVLINLLMNAAQAADKKDSWIRLSVSVNAGGPEPLVIEVSDNGCGMAEETRHKIFDPFFSTKSPVDGTGLGLYVCHMLVEGLRGRIDVRSEPSKGSSFQVILPASKEPKKKLENFRKTPFAL